MAEATSSFQPLRVELEPQLAVAEQRFPQVLRLLTDYDEASDNGEEAKIQAVVESLRQLTIKDIAAADLFEYYEAGSKEELAVRLALPAPLWVGHISRAELLEILRRLVAPVEPTREWQAMKLTEQINSYYLADYYHGLLKLNFPERYRYQDFSRRRGPDGQYYTLSAEEIASKLLA